MTNYKPGFNYYGISGKLSEFITFSDVSRPKVGRHLYNYLFFYAYRLHNRLIIKYINLSISYMYVYN